MLVRYLPRRYPWLFTNVAGVEPGCVLSSWAKAIVGHRRTHTHKAAHATLPTTVSELKLPQSFPATGKIHSRLETPPVHRTLLSAKRRLYVGTSKAVCTYVQVLTSAVPCFESRGALFGGYVWVTARSVRGNLCRFFEVCGACVCTSTWCAARSPACLVNQQDGSTDDKSTVIFQRLSGL